MLSEYDDTLINQTEEFHVEEVRMIDIPYLQHILKQLYGGKSPWSYTIFLLELSRKDSGSYLKVVYQGEVVGFIGLRLEGEAAHVTNIAILPNYQNRGIGSMLLEKAKQYARVHNKNYVTLEVKTSNKSAIRLYHRFGFITKGIKRDYYRENHEDAVDMSLYLGADTNEEI